LNFQHDELQASLLSALEKLLAQTRTEAADGKRSFFDAGLDAALAESGLLDAAGIDEFGPVAATLVVDQVCRLPAIVEIGASSLVRPIICPDWPRPLAVTTGRIERPARFLCEARTVLFLGEADVRVARLEPGDAVRLPEFFAYPMGRLADPASCYARAEPVGTPSEVRRLLNIAIACEIAGALQGALDAVTEHVKNRRQFGRALGSFQAVQHRLAAAATKIVASRLLAQRAAALGTVEDALVAIGYTQDSTTPIIHDLHQFTGAMGLTLEHPLYRWSYRIKLLLSALGGPSHQYRALAGALWDRGNHLPRDAHGALQ
jgi:hypothetical protein